MDTCHPVYSDHFLPKNIEWTSAVIDKQLHNLWIIKLCVLTITTNMRSVLVVLSHPSGSFKARSELKLATLKVKVIRARNGCLPRYVQWECSTPHVEWMSIRVYEWNEMSLNPLLNKLKSHPWTRAEVYLSGCHIPHAPLKFNELKVKAVLISNDYLPRCRTTNNFPLTMLGEY